MAWASQIEAWNDGRHPTGRATVPPSAPRVPLTVACQRLASPDEATVEFPWVRAPRRGYEPPRCSHLCPIADRSPRIRLDGATQSDLAAVPSLKSELTCLMAPITRSLSPKWQARTYSGGKTATRSHPYRVGARMDCDPRLHLGSSSHLLRTETGIPKLVIRLSTLHPILASVR